MTSLCCLLAAATLVRVPIPKLEQKEPPRNFICSIGMKFVWVPAGAFVMGSPMQERGRRPDEAQHTVTLRRGFYMGAYLVTQEQWEAVTGKNPSLLRGEKNLPVENVSWDDCQEFIKKFREKDTVPYRLPTEAEWEYACRAGTTTVFNFGDSISVDRANYDGNFSYADGPKGVYRGKTTPVGSFKANAWGLYDMHGNLGQWCQDWYAEYPPQNAVDPQGPATGGERVLRGGCFSYNPTCCRSAYRIRTDPRSRGSNMGLRVCFSLK